MRLGLPPHRSAVRRSAPRLAAAGLTVGLLVGSAASPLAAAPDERGNVAGRPAPRHSSDGEPGAIAPPMSWARLAGTTRISREAGWRVAPGLEYRRWDQTDARGRIRAYLLTADLSTEGLVLDYASSSLVRDRASLTTLLARDAAVAGINGDFFDIGDTGAPLGVGRDRDIGMRNAPASGWNNAFYLGVAGVPRIGELPMAGTIAEYPSTRLTNVNSPRVRPGGIGVYSRGWGTTTGTRVTDGQRRQVREVVIRGGVVRANSATLSTGRRITGLVLIGRGQGAESLKPLRVGRPATVSWGLAGRPPVAISGNTILLKRGEILARDDREMHPRTAIGVDRDTGQVLMLVVDGRQDFSRGYTMVELARLMKRLGAEAALNLDGGGSSTMVAAGTAGVVRVRNSPSDGQQREIPNGLGITYSPPVD